MGTSEDFLIGLLVGILIGLALAVLAVVVIKGDYIKQGFLISEGVTYTVTEVYNPKEVWRD